MAHAVKDTLPDDSLLFGHAKVGDYMDCYATTCDDTCDNAPDAVAQRVMAFPGWVSRLMALRNTLVRPLGLQTQMPQGPRIGPFPVTERNAQEIVLGADDSHLDFRISIMVRDGRAYVATWVHTHNALGRIYLGAIMPFHILILRNAIARA